MARARVKEEGTWDTQGPADRSGAWGPGASCREATRLVGS